MTDYIFYNRKFIKAGVIIASDGGRLHTFPFLDETFSVKGSKEEELG